MFTFRADALTVWQQPIAFVFKLFTDVSQPSLGTDNDQMDRINTPPLSPMYTGGESGQISVNSKGGKVQVVYHQKQYPAMETHWEESISMNVKSNKDPIDFR